MTWHTKKVLGKPMQVSDLVGIKRKGLGLSRGMLGNSFVFFIDRSIAEQVMKMLNVDNSTTFFSKRANPEFESKCSIIHNINELYCGDKLIGYITRSQASTELLDMLNDDPDTRVVTSCECHSGHAQNHTVCLYCYYHLELAVNKLSNGISVADGKNWYSTTWTTEGRKIFSGNSNKFYPLTKEGLADAINGDNVFAYDLQTSIAMEEKYSDFSNKIEECKRDVILSISSYVVKNGETKVNGHYELDLVACDCTSNLSLNVDEDVVSGRGELLIVDGEALSVGINVGGSDVEINPAEQYEITGLLGILKNLERLLAAVPSKIAS